MNITLRKFTAKDTTDWDEFVERSNNGTMFHTRKFLGYHPLGRFIDHSLIFWKKRKIISVLPAALVKTDGMTSLVSHPGSSLGSCVVPENLAFADSLELTEKLVDYAFSQEVGRIQLTLPPVIYNKRVSQYMDFALKKAGFIYLKRELSSILFLENTIEENLEKFKSTNRTAIRKADKSKMVIKQSDDFKSFYSLLENNLSIRHNVKPTHTLNELLKLKEIYPKRINLFGAFVENEMVAGVINFIVNSQVVLAFYISHKEEYQELRPINLLFYKIFDWAIKARLKVFDFGIFTVDENPNMGLARFKENFGASGVFRDTMELKLPLNNVH